MTDSFDYFDPSSIDQGHGTQWEHLFEEQNGDGSLMEHGDGFTFDDSLVDPQISLESSDVPRPSIEHFQPLENRAGGVEMSTQLAHDSNQQSIPSDPAQTDQNMWQPHSASRYPQDWNTPVEESDMWPSTSAPANARVHNGVYQAPVANMQRSQTDSTPFDFDLDQQQSQQNVESRLWHHDGQIAGIDRFTQHSFSNANSGVHATFNDQDMFDFRTENEQYNMPRLPNQPYPQGYHFNDLSFTQVPSHDLHTAYHNQSFSPELPYNDLDQDYVPDQTPDIFSPSEFSPEPDASHSKRAPKRRQNKPLNPNVTIMKASLPCVAPGCGRPFRNRTHVLDLCNRCARKHDRRTAEAQPNDLDPSVPNMQEARRLIYPPQLGRGPPIAPPELSKILSSEDSYIQRFLDAVNSVVPGGEGGNVHEAGLTWEMRQQITLNQKLRMEGSRKGEEGAYRRPLITARLRALFLETYQFHTGTQECFYAIGGNNAGYNPDTQLSFTERFDLICELLRKNKRMVMDVIEGRGVKSVVANPKGYNKRKVSNNLCNEDKKEIMGKGKERVERSEEPTKKRRRRNGKSVTFDADVGEGEAGPSKRPKRATRSAAAASRSVVGQEDAVDVELREAFRRDGDGDLGGFDFDFDMSGFDERSNTFG